MINPHATLRRKDVRPFQYSDPNGFLFGDNLVRTTYNARAALYQLFRGLDVEPERRTVLLPAFHCTTVVEAVVRAGYRPVYFRIRPDLSIDFDDLFRKAAAGVAAVLAIHYFGFPADIAPLVEARRRGAQWFLIEDWAHSFLKGSTLQLTGELGDFSVYSFYKLVPSHVGGGYRVNVDASFESSSHPVGSRDVLILCKRLIEELIENSSSGSIKRLYVAVERARASMRKRPVGQTPDEPSNQQQYPTRNDLLSAELPALSRWILGMCDLTKMVSKRQANYRLWTANLQERPGLQKLYPQLPDDVCPWAYPVLLTERSQLDYRMRRDNVPLFTFGETLHPTVYDGDSDTVNDAVYLANTLLMFGVHQGLAEHQLLSAAQTVNRFASERENQFSIQRDVQRA